MSWHQCHDTNVRRYQRQCFPLITTLLETADYQRREGWAKWMRTTFSVTLNLNNESGVCAGATSWPFYPSVEATTRSLSFHLTDDDPRWPKNSQQWRGFMSTTHFWIFESLFAVIFYILMCHFTSTSRYTQAYSFLLLRNSSGCWLFSNNSQSRQTINKWFLFLLPITFLFPSLLPQMLSLLLFHPLVSTSKMACFFTPSSFSPLLSSHRTHLSSSVSYSLLLSVWHQRAGTLKGAVVWRG